MTDYTKILFYTIVFLCVLIMPSFSGVTAIEAPFQPGTYRGVVQEYDDFEQQLFNFELQEVTFKVTPEGALAFVSDSGELEPIFQWKSDRWIWEYENEKKTEAIPSIYGRLIVIDYWAYENATKVGGARFYIVLEEKAE